MLLNFLQHKRRLLVSVYPIAETIVFPSFLEIGQKDIVSFTQPCFTLLVLYAPKIRTPSDLEPLSSFDRQHFTVTLLNSGATATFAVFYIRSE